MRTKTIHVTYVTCRECGQEATLRTFRNKLQIVRHKDMRRRRSLARRFNAPICPSSNTDNYDRKSMVRRDELHMSI